MRRTESAGAHIRVLQPDGGYGTNCVRSACNSALRKMINTVLNQYQIAAQLGAGGIDPQR